MTLSQHQGWICVSKGREGSSQTKYSMAGHGEDVPHCSSFLCLQGEIISICHSSGMVFPSLAPLTPQDSKTTLRSLTCPSPLFHPCVAREENCRHKGQRSGAEIGTIHWNNNKITNNNSNNINNKSGQKRECGAWPDFSHATQNAPSSQDQCYPTVPSASLAPTERDVLPISKVRERAPFFHPWQWHKVILATMSWPCSLPLS